MTFRIDGSRLEGRLTPVIWLWSIKGVKGMGVYGRLAARLGEPGLYLLDDLSIEMDESKLIDRDLLVCERMSKEQADAEFRSAMERLDWGPEVKDPWRR